ncbi:conserved hypothetical protein [Desulforamulus reducens MI-1]|uniref:Putative cysteine ligase BshC n=1 Tax=Desulforamulus reducens (strain ATCC BAA-1160 / DSM 100696 / MI-1) TaxID=349161 RepID=BSHC_DESRM|nr:bacillithiol biosynthesis cysteine-adding enzyme BshC [Desulforamulus reducens]A4J3Q5.1 RecName: Full=Putative cysteine ligase BshC [Desulforamulus reducens MI-1]ABO49708.1 conserved hypothetical protein [Desulforamulus reducens MI-1]
MRIEYVDSFYSQPFPGTYMRDFGQVKHFFEYNPHQLQEYKTRCEHELALPKEHLVALAENLKDFNQGLGCGEKTLHNIELLDQGKALTVVTGQQPGILTGPLYTIYKAMGTIGLAEKLSKELNRKVIPVFWIGADDHDHEEINHIFIPTAKGPKRITLAGKPAGRISVGNIPIPDIALLLEELEDLLPPIGWKNQGIELIKRTAHEAANLAEWFGKLMTFLFKDYGLVFINPVLPQVRAITASLFYKVVTTAPAVNQLLQASCQQMLGCGYTPQVQGEKDKLHLFWYNEHGYREALYYKKGLISNKDGTRTWTKGQLGELCLTNPAKFSPDVVMRPVVQEKLLPVLAYVAGPGEISYYALLKRIFHYFAMKMPVIYPRPNITVIEPLIKRLITKYQVPLSCLTYGLEEFIENYLQQEDQLGIETVFNELRGTLKEKQGEVVKKLSILDPDIEGMGKENLKRLIRVVNSFEEKVKQRHRKNNQVAIQQLQKIQHMTQPMGQWQERVYNIFPYVMKYGPGIIKEMYHLIEISDWRQKIIFFD